MPYLTTAPIPLPTAQRTFWLPNVTVPPMLSTVVEWPVFHVTVLPRDWPVYALIELAAEQADRNRLPTYLVLDTQTAFWFGGPQEVKAGRIERFASGVVTDRMALVRELPIRPEDLERMSGLGRVLRGREPERLPSIYRAGFEATPEQIEHYAGTEWDGVPRRLERCVTCDEPRGWCLQEVAGRSLMVRVRCACAPPSLCARCLMPFHSRPLRSHWWDGEARQLRYVPGFPALEHRCDRRDAVGSGSA